MADAIVVTSGVVVPSSAITVRNVRSSGPGGQNVNKVSSKVELRVDVALVTGLDDPARRRLASLAGRMLDARGILRLSAQTSRDRYRNLEAVRERVRRLVERALVTPKARRTTRPRAADRERRLHEKKRASAVKAGRQPPSAED